MKITKINYRHRDRFHILRNITGVSVKRLSFPALHHGLIQIKNGAEIDELLEPSKVFRMPSALSEGFKALNRATNVNLEILYSNAIELGLNFLEEYAREDEQNPFISFG